MSSKTSEPTASRLTPEVTTKLFQASKPPPSTLPAVLAVFEALADRLSFGLGALTSLSPNLTLDSITRGYPTDVPTADAAVVGASAFVPQWNGRIQVHYDRLLMVRFVEAMFGGNAARPMSASTRELTAFESALVISITDVILKEIQATFSGNGDISLTDIACSPTESGRPLRDDPTGAIVAQFRMPQFGDALWIALPAVGLDLVADTTSTREHHDTPGLDPRWTRDLGQTLGGTSMSLVAVAHAATISIGDVAVLRPGSLLEFDAECLNAVRLECADQAVLVGRLGQSKGRYTLCVETMASMTTDRDGK